MTPHRVASRARLEIASLRSPASARCPGAASPARAGARRTRKRAPGCSVRCGRPGSDVGRPRRQHLRRRWAPSASRRTRPVVLTGSHIDTVPEGGILDGALGVLAGLECLHAIARGGAAPTRARWSSRRGATRRAATAASSARARSAAGSTPRAIPTMAAVDGERLVDAMARAGFDAQPGARGAAAPAGAVARLRRAAHRAGPAAGGGRAFPSASSSRSSACAARA